MKPGPQKSTGASPSVRLALVILCAGIFFAALDQTVIYGALADIMKSLCLPVTRLDQAAWVVIGYLLGYAMAMPLMGRVSDVYGHGRIYALSLLIFMGGSVLAAAAHSLYWMVGARVIQAAGGGAMVPVAMAIVGDIVPAERRSVALGIVGATVEAGGVLGPFYGAVIAQYVGWRWIFWINLPISFAVLLLFYFFMLGIGSRVRAKVDYVGGFLLAAGLTFLALGLSHESGHSHSLTYLASFLAISFFAFALFLLRERKASEPLFHLSLFRLSNFSAANSIHLLVGSALIIAMVNIPLMTDTIMGKAPLEGGLRLMRLTAAIPIGALAGGFICRRTGYRLPTALGLTLSSLGFFFMSHWSLGIADPAMTIHLVTCGFGFGLVIAPINTAVINSVEEWERGVASALVTLMRLIGMIIGLSALSSWGMGHFHVLTAGLSLEEIVASPDVITRPVLTLFQDFFLVGFGICLVALIPVMWMRGGAEPR